MRYGEMATCGQNAACCTILSSNNVIRANNTVPSWISMGCREWETFQRAENALKHVGRDHYEIL